MTTIVRGAAQYSQARLQSIGSLNRHNEFYYMFDANDDTTYEAKYDFDTNTMRLAIPELLVDQPFAYYLALESYHVVTYLDPAPILPLPAGEYAFPTVLTCEQIDNEYCTGKRIVHTIPMIIRTDDTGTVDQISVSHGQIGHQDLNWQKLNVQAGERLLKFNLRATILPPTISAVCKNVDCLTVNAATLHFRLARHLESDGRIGQLPNELDSYRISSTDDQEPSRKLRRTLN